MSEERNGDGVPSDRPGADESIGDETGAGLDAEQSATVLEKLPDGVFTVDEEFVVTSVNEAVTSMTGYPREELLGSHSTMLTGEETLAVTDEIIAQFRGEGDVGLVETTIRTADGETLPIETRFSTVELDDGSKQRVGVLRDATERRRQERAFETLNRSARQLLHAREPADVCETVVDAVTSVWSGADVVVYLYDDSETALEPTASEGIDPEPRTVGTTEWEAFTTGDRRIDLRGRSDPNAGDDAPSFRRPESKEAETTADGESQPTGRVLEPTDEGEVPDRRLFVTLDEYGLLVVDLPARSFSPEPTELVELLAANAVAAFGRAEHETELSRQRDALADRSDRLERLHEFNDLLRRINGALVDADTLEGIASAVCEHLVDAEPVRFAWIGDRYGTSEGVRSIARAGGDCDGYLDDVDVLAADLGRRSSGSDRSGDADRSAREVDRSSEPTVRALASGTAVVVDDVSEGFRESRWRKRALSCGFQSVMSVPLVYSDLEYGVLSVYADRADAFADEFGDLLAELGTTVANAINSIETKRSLRRESAVELELRIEDPGALLPRLAAALGERIEIVEVFPRNDGRSVVYLRTDGEPSSLAADLVAVESVRTLADAADATAEVTVTRSPIDERLADYGARVETLVADADGIETTLFLPRSTDVRRLIETLEEEYGGVDLRARRERTSVADPAEPVGAVEDRLTDRQLEVVRTAYQNGYFEWPRANTGEEIAESLGITQPTFNRHLRVAERRLFASLFDEEDSG